MVKENPDERISLEEIENDPWYKTEDLPTDEDIIILAD